MAEEQAKTPAAAEVPVVSGKKKQTLMMLGILFFVMAAEGGGIYFAVKFMGGGPAKAGAEGLAAPAKAASHESAKASGGHGGAEASGHGDEGEKGAELTQDAELQVVKLKAPNMKSGRLFLYDLEIYAKTKREKADTLKKLIEGSKATIEDRLNRVVRSAEPQDLQEDGLETIRRQVKHELSQVVGDEKMIEEILIPKCTPFKVDF